ncbi:MAG: 50S ribosomal protein L9 [Leptospiraceae bacterium]|nr:50S ribosomal protein L9 [Leptospiraceae bacterium]
MKVILQKDVPNLGDAGEVRNVAAGYARNYLLPNKLVIVAKGGSTRALEHQQKLMAIKSEKRKSEMQGVAASMAGVGTLTIEARVGTNGKMFGSVTAITIAQALKEKGYAIDKRKIELTEKIKAPGSYQVQINLAEAIKVNLGIEVKGVVADTSSEEEYDQIAEIQAKQKADDERRAAEKAAAEAEAAAAEAAEATVADTGAELESGDQES